MSGELVARVEDVPDGGALALDAERLVLARCGDDVFAYVNECPHAGHRLDRDGRVLLQAARFIVCPHHGASFELRGGACVGGPCAGKSLTRVAVAVRDGAIILQE